MHLFPFAIPAKAGTHPSAVRNFLKQLQYLASGWVRAAERWAPAFAGKVYEVAMDDSFNTL
jgi:hypothetical protein